MANMTTTKRPAKTKTEETKIAQLVKKAVS